MTNHPFFVSDTNSAAYKLISHQNIRLKIVPTFDKCERALSVVEKNASDKSCMVSRRTSDGDLGMTLNLCFEDYFKINFVFFNGNTYFLYHES